jgi:hypothetical protein
MSPTKISRRLHEIEFEQFSIMDIEGKEWLISGIYFADMDRSGEYEYDGFEDLIIARIDGSGDEIECGGLFPNQFAESAITSLSRVLAQKLYDKLTGGQS